MARRSIIFHLFIASCLASPFATKAQERQAPVLPNQLVRALAPDQQQGKARSVVEAMSAQPAKSILLSPRPHHRVASKQASLPVVSKPRVAMSLPENPFQPTSATTHVEAGSEATRSNNLESSTDAAEWFGTVMSFPAASESGAKIIVHQPHSMPGNEYAFLVENVGSKPAGAFHVEFETPTDVSVLKVFPFNAESTANTVTVNFERLAAGEASPVHIKTTSYQHGNFVIKSRIRMEQRHEFEVFSTEPSPEQRVTVNQVDREIPITQPDRLGFEEPEPGETGLTTRRTVKDTRLVSVMTNPHSDLPANSRLSTTLAGSEFMVQGGEYEFEITVANPSSQPGTEIIIQLALPEGLMITNLDRQAWIDQENRTVSWKIDHLASMEMDKIRYQVRAVNLDRQVQQVVVGMNSEYQGEIKLTSVIHASGGVEVKNQLTK